MKLGIENIIADFIHSFISCQKLIKAEKLSGLQNLY